MKCPDQCREKFWPFLARAFGRRRASINLPMSSRVKHTIIFSRGTLVGKGNGGSDQGAAWRQCLHIVFYPAGDVFRGAESQSLPTVGGTSPQHNLVFVFLELQEIHALGVDLNERRTATLI